MAFFAYLTTPADRTTASAIAGYGCILTFLCIWALSLAAPVLLPALLYFHWYGTFAVLGLCALASYTPNGWIKMSLPLRSFFLRYGAASYYRNSSLRYLAPLPTSSEIASGAKAPTVLAVHPHGITCQGWGAAITADETRHFTFCFADVLYASPFFRLFCRFLGKPSGCSKAAMKSLMRRKEPIALIPGGFNDATIHTSQCDRVYLNKRKGFVAYSMEFGYSLTPCFVFGERETYSNFQASLTTQCAER